MFFGRYQGSRKHRSYQAHLPWGVQTGLGPRVCDRWGQACHLLDSRWWSADGQAGFDELLRTEHAGCEDADDAFSIYVENEKLYLAIHIADPTEYINIKSDLWKDIVDRVVTRYPSNRKPVHMMPEKIMAKASLMDNEYGNIKMAIT